MTAKDTLLAILSDRVIAYHVTFAKVGGGATAGLFLSQLFYWTGKGAKPDGWVWKSAREMEEETGLTKREQQTARKRLRSRGLIEEKLAGIPATVHYRVDIDKLIELVGQLVQNAQLDDTKEANYSETTHETTQRHGADAPLAPADDPTEEPPEKYNCRICFRFTHIDEFGVCATCNQELENGDLCADCEKYVATSAQMPRIAEVCKCSQEAALVEAFGPPPERPKRKPPPHWHELVQDPRVLWGDHSDTFKKLVRQHGESGVKVKFLGYDWEQLAQLEPDWEDKQAIKSWSSGLWVCLKAAGGDASIVLDATRKAIEDGLTISDPYSVVKVTRALCGERKRGTQQRGGMGSGIVYA